MHNPSADEVKAARKAANQTQAEAAATVYASTRAWQKWEGAERKMRPSDFELYKIKTASKKNG